MNLENIRLRLLINSTGITKIPERYIAKTRDKRILVGWIIINPELEEIYFFTNHEETVPITQVVLLAKEVRARWETTEDVLQNYLVWMNLNA